MYQRKWPCLILRYGIELRLNQGLATIHMLADALAWLAVAAKQK
jgi:hypothetical protein